MTYWLVIFQVPVPAQNLGALKYKITRVRYENICELEGLVIDCDKGTFELSNKRIFAIEADNAAFIVVDGKKY